MLWVKSQELELCPSCPDIKGNFKAKTYIAKDIWGRPESHKIRLTSALSVTNLGHPLPMWCAPARATEAMFDPTANSDAFFMSLSPNKPGFRCAQTYPQPQWSVHTRGVPAGVANVKKMWDYRFRGRDICMSKSTDPNRLARASTPHSNSLLRGSAPDQRGQSLIIDRPRSSCSSYQQVTVDTCHDRNPLAVLSIDSGCH